MLAKLNKFKWWETESISNLKDWWNVQRTHIVQRGQKNLEPKSKWKCFKERKFSFTSSNLDVLS